MNYLPEFQLLRPTTAQQAVDLRATHVASRFLAGGPTCCPISAVAWMRPRC